MNTNGSRKHTALRIACMAFCFIAAAWCSAARGGDNWPEFRGPTADGHADAVGLPIHWSEKENVKWKVAIHGKGWSSPVIWGKQIWMTTAPVDGKKLYAIAVDRDSGKIVHNINLFDSAKTGGRISTNSYTTPN